MSERPILFPGPDVRAILEGRKTQARRIVTPQPSGGVRATGVVVGASSELSDAHGRPIRIPFRPGDLLWVRETWAAQHGLDPLRPSEMRHQDTMLHYAATEERGGLLWRSPILMPRWASRITLRVTNVRVQRLQEISEQDARAEGCRDFFEQFPQIGRDQRLTCGALASDAPHRASFAVTWDDINHKRAPWASNPWVWAISFERMP